MLKGEERFAKANEMVQWTISSDERREPKRAAGLLDPARGASEGRRGREHMALFPYLRHCNG